MQLTEAGELYLSRIVSIVDELARAHDDVVSTQSDPIGTLRLTTSVAFGQVCLMPLVPDFRARFPRLKLELVMADANLDLVVDRIDLAIRLAPSYGADVIGVKLFPTRYRVVASPDYLEQMGQVSEPGDLVARNCVLLALPDYRSRWLFRQVGTVEEVPISGDFICSSVLALRSAALAGLGPALLVDWLIDEELASGRLIDLFPDHDVTATTYETAAWLLYPSRQYMPNKVRAMIQFLRSRLPSRHAG
jgi:DNA-binding transcriptional LysR family regulator